MKLTVQIQYRTFFYGLLVGKLKVLLEVELMITVYVAISQTAPNTALGIAGCGKVHVHLSLCLLVSKYTNHH